MTADAWHSSACATRLRAEGFRGRVQEGVKLKPPGGGGGVV